jgi:hypothetical protein
MITSLAVFFNSWTLLLNFVSHFVVFIGILYVAIHNRELKSWVITPLWYLGLTSGFVCATIVVQWAVGPEHPMSYWTLGVVGEIMSHFVLAAISFILFIKTLKADLNYKRLRKK